MVKKNLGQNLWKKAKKLIPGGNMFLSKRSEIFLPDYWPSYYYKSKGCEIWDLNNKKYYDLSLMSAGTNVLGYCNKEIDKVVKKTIELGNMTTLNCPEEYHLAKTLIKIHPWANMVKLARSGGEANSIAVRIARAATFSDKIAVCGYHGWHDWYLAANLMGNKKLDEHLLPGLTPNGVPKYLKNTVYTFMYNDYDKIKYLVEKRKIRIVKMEVCRDEYPKNNFLIKVRKLCNKNKAILIFDECTTGFRETYGGIHLKFKVNPDIAVFGKALGNGYPITAVIGKRKIMNFAQSTFMSSTFWSERIGPTAALKTLEYMKKNKTWIEVKKKGQYLKKKIKEISIRTGIPINISGLDSFPTITFKDKNVYYKTLLTHEMLKKGFLASNVIFVSIQHKKKIIDKYLYNLEKILIDIKKKKIKLKGKSSHTTFKRLT